LGFPEGVQTHEQPSKGDAQEIVTHVLLHEIRHRAQIATLFRLNGLKADFHDFLFSPVMGGELRREVKPA
jgi:uncharacterized damage-inducible protein DinB